MSFAQFEHSPKGQRIRPVIANAEAVGKMLDCSRQGLPALFAVADQIEKVAPDLSDTEKQHVGRWIHRLLGPKGWRPVDKKRMPSGSLFRTAAVYAPIASAAGKDRFAPPASPAGDTGSRLERARARIRALPTRPEATSEFLASKRLAAKREM